jgi:uncharacterized membrane protein YhaH (DUF805 family)
MHQLREAIQAMDFQEAVQSGFRRWNRTDGRSSRSEYWWWVLFYVLALFGAALVADVLGGIGRGAAEVWLVVLLCGFILLLVPTLTLSVRRLHDTNRSGLWLLLNFVPYIGGLILLVLYCLDGSPGPNHYGERPGGNLPGYRPGGLDAAPFAPTVRVPPEGMASWPTADPAGPVTPLAAGLHLAVLHRVDDWAQVRASNGWVGWVDARRLASLAPPPPQPLPPSPPDASAMA